MRYEVIQQYHHIINLLKEMMWLPVLGDFPSFILAVAHSHVKAVDVLFGFFLFFSTGGLCLPQLDSTFGIGGPQPISN